MNSFTLTFFYWYLKWISVHVNDIITEVMHNFVQFDYIMSYELRWRFIKRVVMMMMQRPRGLKAMGSMESDSE